jgi:hypothetical protein
VNGDVLDWSREPGIRGASLHVEGDERDVMGKREEGGDAFLGKRKTWPTLAMDMSGPSPMQARPFVRILSLCAACYTDI